MQFFDHKSLRVKRLGTLVLLLVILMGGCASPISPGGGPYDETPPVLLKSEPLRNALNVRTRKIVLTFDEYIQLKDISKKVIISPPQLERPSITALGKKIEVELNDTLIPQTTYSIDFTNAIVDNNEGNELENFSFAFSTGDVIDSMEISGVVLNARNLEPIQNVVVGVQPADLGTKAFRDTTLTRMSRTSDRPHFAIRNMKQGTYRVYVLNETDGNYRYNNVNEGIAFMDTTYTTSSTLAYRNDTIWQDSLTVDTIKRVRYTRFMPDDLVLRYFMPKDGRRFLKKRERPDTLQLKLSFNQPIDTLFSLTLPDSVPPVIEQEPPYAVDRSGDGTLTIFLIDSAYIRSSRFVATYHSVDSTQVPILVKDTLDLRPPQPKKEEDKGGGFFGGRDQEETTIITEDSLGRPKPSPLTVKFDRKGSGGRRDSMFIQTSLPIDTTVLKAIKLYSVKDSVRNIVPLSTIRLVEGSCTSIYLNANLAYNSSYQVEVDSLLFTDLYGHHLDKTFTSDFKTKPSGDLSSLEIIVHGVSGPYIFELLNEQDTPIRVISSRDSVALFSDIDAGKYYVRLILDRNGNGRWDTGDYDLTLQPEEVYYAPKVFEVMKNWKVRENFYPLMTPLNKQKPTALIKAKPEEKQKRNLNKRREEELRNRNRGQSNGLGGLSQGIGGLRNMMRQ